MKSNMEQRRELWQRLTSKGMTQGELSDTPLHSSPWFVKVLMAFSGWLAALFLFGFVGIALEHILESAVICFFTGSGMIALAYVMLMKMEADRRDYRVSKQEFLEHLALAISLAGQILVAIAIFDVFDDAFKKSTMSLVVFGCLQAGLSIIMPNYLHRLLSAMAAALCWYFACVFRSSGYAGLDYLLVPILMLGVSLLWLNELSLARFTRILEPVAYGLTLSIVYIKGTLMFSAHHLVWYLRKQEDVLVSPWMGELLTTLVLIFVVVRLMQSLGFALKSPQTLAAIAGCGLIGLISIESYGVGLGVMILLLGFYNSNRLLMGLGVVSLLFYISSYYYFLDVTLLVKSFTLLVLGMVLLIGRKMVLKTWGPSNEG